MAMMTTAWIYLLVAAACEVVWAIALKQTEGFTRLGPSLVTVVFMLVSFVLLAQAMRSLPVGTAYAVWTGIGAVGTAILGIVLYGEPRGTGRILSLILVVLGVAGLRYFSRA